MKIRSLSFIQPKADDLLNRHHEPNISISNHVDSKYRLPRRLDVTSFLDRPNRSDHGCSRTEKASKASKRQGLAVRKNDSSKKLSRNVECLLERMNLQ